ncbi:NFACT RNA binding domain-containing protein, partial [Candidatus Bipolaricaulota bacterium]
RAGSRTLRYGLTAELVGLRGSLILTLDDRVIGSSRHDVRNPIGATYAPLPPQERIEPRTLTPEALLALLEGGGAARALARSIDGVGRQSAEDLMARIGNTGDLDEREISARVGREFEKLLESIEEPAPHVDRAGGRAAFYPLPPPAEVTSSYCAALDAVALSPGAGDLGEQDDARRFRRAIDRRQRTVVKLREWLDSSAEADRLQALADLVMIHHRDIEPKAEQATLVDPSTGAAVVVRLQPALSAIENAQRLYERAKRLRRGKPHVASRLARIERELERLRQAQAMLEETGAIDSDVAKLLAGKPSRVTVSPARPAFRSVEVEGLTIWIGRSATDNDRILRAAAPDDVWMHVEGHAGSHVIVRRDSAGEIPQAVLVHAAQLAAANSKARGERRVRVTVAEVKHVKKPRGAPAGLVHVRNADTLTVEPMKEVG